MPVSVTHKGRNKLPAEQRRVDLPARVPQALKDALRQKAVTLGMSVGELIELLWETSPIK